MLYCENCRNEFESPLIVIEKHGLGSPPFEKTYCCPICGASEIAKQEVRYCRCCGKRIINQKKEYCSTLCRERGEELRIREKKRKEYLASSPLSLLIKELNEYNAKNHTEYSYGEYVAIIKPRGKKR